MGKIDYGITLNTDAIKLKLFVSLSFSEVGIGMSCTTTWRQAGARGNCETATLRMGCDQVSLPSKPANPSPPVAGLVHILVKWQGDFLY